MRLLVVGSGAVGLLIAWIAASERADVTVVRRRRTDPPAPEDLTLERFDGRRATVSVTATPSVAAVAGATGESRPFDLVVLAVKQFDLPGALAAIEPLAGVPAITLQNGVGAEATALAARPDAPLLAGSLTASADLGEDGTVRWLRRGGLGVASVRAGAAPVGAELLALARSAGIPGRAYRDAASMKWSKLVANLTGNATAAILDMDPAEVYGDGSLFEIERAMLGEAFAVMDRLGLAVVNLPGAPVRLLRFGMRLPAILVRPVMRRRVRGARGGKSPSLRLAMTRPPGRAESDRDEVLTETRWLNGAVVEAGRSTAVQTPVNALLVDVLEQIGVDPERRAWFRGRPDRLVEAVDEAGAET